MKLNQPQGAEPAFERSALAPGARPVADGQGFAAAARVEIALAQHRPFLLRLARSQLDDALAEDAVQETLLAAWHGSASFQGLSSLRTWLVAILRYKIIDQIRQRQSPCRPFGAARWRGWRQGV